MTGFCGYTLFETTKAGSELRTIGWEFRSEMREATKQGLCNVELELKREVRQEFAKLKEEIRFMGALRTKDDEDCQTTETPLDQASIFSQRLRRMWDEK